MDLEELKKLAEAATPGPWELHRHGVIKAGPLMQFTNGSGRKQIVMVTGAEWMREGEQYDNAAYIAAANPQTILALIAEIARLNHLWANAEADLSSLSDENARLKAELEEARKDATESVLAPKKYPLSNDFDEELFNLCRDDNYAGLYEALLSRATSARQQTSEDADLAKTAKIQQGECMDDSANKKEVTLQMIMELRNYDSWSYMRKHKEGPYWSIAECRQILIDNNGDMQKAKERIDRIHAPKA